MSDVKKRLIKEIKADLDKCIGCRACELACSAFHAKPKYSSINPDRARIRMVIDEQNDVYVPVRGGEYAKAECSGRQTYKINGIEYPQCSFCGASCPSRDWFKEPDSGLPIACDMCEDIPPQKEPMCVQVCRTGALTYVEYEEECEEKATPDEMELGLESLADRYGLDKVMNAVARMAQQGTGVEPQK
ncbi:Fe-S-cluster-containing dehydrogenase component [Syntrophus gentianae]|uniref:Fe-S-cluster-containing dehydrogenase component n=1 Tax=Syntrophus gentianae TaxID=43775 RepID=A0A1H7YZ62_9BACT|nr:(4Fe-4S)-binding protein [Syntrophus gentianae]SEM51285.1 Fe-S-cluster-containing dehydrogenase component [Syntrophus gentianae]